MAHKGEMELTIAVTELLTNALKFGTSAHVWVRLVTSPGPGVQVVIKDNGPGFQRIDLAPLDGYSEGRFLIEDESIAGRRGLGLGLGAVSRLTDKFELKNLEEGGACVTIWKWLPREGT